MPVHLEVEFGVELRERIRSGARGGRSSEVVKAALAGRCEVSRQEAARWAAAFGRGPRSAAPTQRGEEYASPP
eukprot:5595292-Alexandrium_andersonii.AAC.1